MNTWMSDPFPYPDEPIDRGKASRAEKLRRDRRVGPLQGRGRRRHPVPDRARATGCPRTSARGSGHNERAQYSERPDDYVHNMDRLARKFETARTLVPKPEVDVDAGGAGRPRSPSARRTGPSSRAATSCARRRASRTSYLRLRAYPFTRGARGVHRRATTASTSSSRTATARCSALMRWSSTRRPHRAGCAASGTTTGCRSTPARSRTTSSAQEGRRRCRGQGSAAGMHVGWTWPDE